MSTPTTSPPSATQGPSQQPFRQLPPTMQAWTFTRSGPPNEVLQLTTLPTPLPSNLKPNEVIVKVSHVALNYGGLLLFRLLPHWDFRSWWWGKRSEKEREGYIPEMELCGTVVAVGSAVQQQQHEQQQKKEKSSVRQVQKDVSSDRQQAKHQKVPITVGTQILSFLPPTALLTHTGALTSYLTLPLSALIRKPTNLPPAEAAGVLACGWTAINAADAARLKRGDKVLVNGASGGVGAMLVQVARERVGESGTVVGVCSGRNEGFVRGLGVDEVVDYNLHTPLHTYMQQHHSNPPFNAIFDIVGNKALRTHCPSYLAKDGLYDLIGAMDMVENASWWEILWWLVMAKLEAYRPVMLGGVPRRHRMHNAMVGREAMERVVEMAERGGLRVALDSVWKMEDGIKAYERAMSKRARGKIIIAVEE